MVRGFHSTAALAAALAGALAGPSASAQAQDAADRAASAQVASEHNPPSEESKPRPRVDVTTPAPATASAETGGIFVGAITVSGLQALVPADFADIIAERIGRTLTSDDLAALANAISERMRARGFPLGTARIEAQRLTNGVLVVRADEGRIDEIRIDGASLEAVREALAPLQNARPVRLRDIERRLLIAGDIDGVQVQSSRFFREGDRGILLVKVTHDRVAAWSNLSNQGTRPVGPEQARLQVNVHGVLASDDSLTLSYSAAAFEPRELQFGYIRYEKRISPSGTEIALSGSGSVSHPGAYLQDLNIKNRSWYLGISALQPLLRRKKASYWLEGEFGVRNLVQWREGLQTRRDQLAVGRLTAYGYRNFVGGRLRTSLTLSQGLGILDATETGDPLASRRDADGTFTAANAWADWTSDLGSNVSIRVAAQGQLASQPLLISEEAGLGGTSFLRGYDWGERTGDQGAMGMAELRYALKRPFGVLKQAQLYAFVDGGTVSNHDDGFGGGSLASAGGGLRLDITSHLGATLELAVPLTGPRYDTGDRTPKVNFSLGRSFR